MNYEKTIKTLEKIVKKAYKLYMKKGVQNFEHKSANDLLTDTDLKMDKYISEKLKKHFPTCNLMTEELNSDTILNGFTFVVDPVDGTCNFKNKLDLSGVQIAMFNEKECVLSLIYLPYRKEMYTAILNEGAYLNGKKLHVDKKINNEESILQLSDFYTVNPISMNNQFELVKNLQNKFLKTRLFGAACVDFTNLASNKIQAYISYYYHLWDIAPGLLLVKEAGGEVGSLTKEEYEYGDKNIIVANNQESLNIIKKEFEKNERAE